MSSGHHPPHQVVYHSIVFILSSTVVSVQVDVGLPQPMYVKEKIQPADYSIGPLPRFTRVVCEEVYLSGDCLAVNPKHRTLPWGEEVYMDPAVVDLKESGPKKGVVKVL